MKKNIKIVLLLSSIVITTLSIIFNIFFTIEIAKLKQELRKVEGFEQFFPEAIIDNQPDSFKDFILNNNTPELLDTLYKNLDEESKLVIKSNLHKMLNIPDNKYKDCYLVKKTTFQEKLNAITGRKINNEYLFEKYFNKKRYKFPHKCTTAPYIEHGKCGLRYANNKIKNYIKNKIFIDGGASFGDSALVILEYNPKKIYSFDLLDSNIRGYKRTMQINNVPKELYEIHKLAIADKKSTYTISSEDFMGGIFDTGNYYPKDATIESIDIDTFLKNKKETVGFIHADLQGAMCEAISGMKETIKKDRPVLSLDISNSPKEFFYAKPMLEEIVKDLNYKITIIDYKNIMPLTILGVTIFAYPKELEN